MNQGWIKLHRQLLEWEWFDDHNTFRLFIYCLLKANHKDKSYRGETIKRGTFVTSLETLSNETGISVRSIRTSLKRLESTHEVTSERSTKGTVIQVVNYKDYQDVTRKVTTKRQASDNYQECKEIKEEYKGVLLKWIEYRKQLKKPLTDHGIKTLANKFNSKPLPEVEWVINHSIENGWQGLFWDKYTEKQLPKLDKQQCNIALQVPQELNKLLEKGYTMEQIKEAVK